MKCTRSNKELVFERLESIVGRENAVHQHIVPSHIFLKTGYVSDVKFWIVWGNSEPFPKQTGVFTYLQYKSSKSTVGKGDNASFVDFSFPTFFSTLLVKSSAIFFNVKIVFCKLFWL